MAEETRAASKSTTAMTLSSAKRILPGCQSPWMTWRFQESKPKRLTRALALS